MHPGQQRAVVFALNGILEGGGGVRGLIPQGTGQSCTEHPQDCWSASISQASVLRSQGPLFASLRADHEPSINPGDDDSQEV